MRAKKLSTWLMAPLTAARTVGDAGADDCSVLIGHYEVHRADIEAKLRAPIG
jgi:hypothetical protein